MTIYERALEFIRDGDAVGLGSGRASSAFITALGARVKSGLKVRGVPTSNASAELARSVGIPLVELSEAMPLALTVDGADEVDPRLNAIKGWGRALLREKIVAAASRKLVILVGVEKKVPVLGTRGKLPVEVVPFALPLCRARLIEMGLNPIPDERDGKMFVTDNGNFILDCMLGPIADAAGLERKLQAVPGVVCTGLFLGLADLVLFGDEARNFELVEEQSRASGGR